VSDILKLKVFFPVNSVNYVNRSQVIRRWEQLGIHTRELIFMLDVCVFTCLFIYLVHCRIIIPYCVVCVKRKPAERMGGVAYIPSNRTQVICITQQKQVTNINPYPANVEKRVSL
jgi:hypothetical protein